VVACAVIGFVAALALGATWLFGAGNQRHLLGEDLYLLPAADQERGDSVPGLPERLTLPELNSRIFTPTTRPSSSRFTSRSIVCSHEHFAHAGPEP
jgi:hypothetical protein